MSGSVTKGTSCPACGSERVETFYEVDRVPVNSVLLLRSRAEAVAITRGRIRLNFCESCSFIYNGAFDPELTEYSSRCEETQSHSPYFQKWHKDLALRLIERHALSGKEILEIGCGKGEFLALLCELSGNRGVGFDPAYVEDRGAQIRDDLRFIRDNYSAKYSGSAADFVCCKMTLEHIPDAFRFLTMVRGTLGANPRAVLFVQVPDASRILAEQAFWDIYYEHCSYYTASSLSHLLASSGFEVLSVSHDYGKQYLLSEARLATGKSLANSGDLADTRNLVRQFVNAVPRKLSTWARMLSEHKAAGRRVVIWGSGSKGVAFLNGVDCDRTIQYVVDVNPNRVGHYMAGSGQEIVAPDFLREYRPHSVVIMNPLYRDEIVRELRKMKIDPEVVTL